MIVTDANPLVLTHPEVRTFGVPPPRRFHTACSSTYTAAIDHANNAAPPTHSTTRGMLTATIVKGHDAVCGPHAHTHTPLS